jgi:hypothetical protein
MVWKPGQSGNPLGRPKGARNLATVAVEKMLQGELNSITRKCIDMALAGEPVALKLCLERLMPPLKGRHLQLELPAVTDAASALAAMSKVTEAVGNGEITTDDAAAVAGAVPTTILLPAVPFHSVVHGRELRRLRVMVALVGPVSLPRPAAGRPPRR